MRTWALGDVSLDSYTNMSDMFYVKARIGTLDPWHDVDLNGAVNLGDQSLVKSWNAIKTTVPVSYSSVDNPYHFTGRTTDTLHASDPLVSVDPDFKRLQDNRNRAYDPKHGRWLQRDPERYVDGMNQYEYVRSRSLVGVDPDGRAYKPISARAKACQRNCDAVLNACDGLYLGPSSKAKKLHKACTNYCQAWAQVDWALVNDAGNSETTIADVVYDVGTGIVVDTLDLVMSRSGGGVLRGLGNAGVAGKVAGLFGTYAEISGAFDNFQMFGKAFTQQAIGFRLGQFWRHYEDKKDHVIKDYGGGAENCNIRGSRYRGEFRNAANVGGWLKDAKSNKGADSNLFGHYVSSCDREDDVYVFWATKHGSLDKGVFVIKSITTSGRTKKKGCKWADEIMLEIAYFTEWRGE